MIIIITLSLLASIIMTQHDATGQRARRTNGAVCWLDNDCCCWWHCNLHIIPLTDLRALPKREGCSFFIYARMCVTFCRLSCPMEPGSFHRWRCDLSMAARPDLRAQISKAKTCKKGGQLGRDYDERTALVASLAHNKMASQKVHVPNVVWSACQARKQQQREASYIKQFLMHGPHYIIN